MKLEDGCSSGAACGRGGGQFRNFGARFPQLRGLTQFRRSSGALRNYAISAGANLRNYAISAEDFGSRGAKLFARPIPKRLPAISGFLPKGYRGAHVAMNLREANKFAQIRHVGPASCAHTAPKHEAAQHARVGFCARCTRTTHVAIPPMLALAAADWLKSGGAALLKTHEPWASRRLAARSCAHASGHLSKFWDWGP